MEYFLNIGKKYFNMGNVIKQNAGQVSSNGSSLVIYVDVATGEVMLKDVVGNTQPLKDFFKYNEIVFLKSEKGSFISANETNKIDAELSAVLSGEYNVVRGDNSVVAGGNANTISRKNSFIGSGRGNDIDSDNSTIVGGANNSTKYNNTHLLGSNIEANREDATFVENLSITNIPNSDKGLPKGAVWNNKGVLSIVT
jgi:hypothetical protein